MWSVHDRSVSDRELRLAEGRSRKRQWPITTLVAAHIDIDKVSDEEIQEIVLTSNLTPRKCLGFKTPFQAILKELGKDVQIRFS